MSLIQEIITNGEMRMWHDYSSGSLSDLSGNGNDGVFINTPFINRLGVQTNGVDNYIQVTDSASLSFGDGSTDTALTFIVKVHNLDSQTFFIHKADDSLAANNFEYEFRTDPNSRVVGRVNDASASAYIGQYANAGAALDLGKSYTIVMTYDAGGLSAGVKLYANGLPIASSANETGSYTAMEDLNKNLGVGRYGGFYSKTTYEHVMMMARELDATEVAQITGELENKIY